MIDVAIHINTSLPHQREHGQWFASGFKRHGIKAEVTSDRYKEADIHVVSGPHYAKQVWIDHPRVILLDRCYYRGNPDHVSLGWMRKDGGRNFQVGNGREPPEPETRRTGSGSIFLADYAGRVEHADTVRLHPSRENHREPLRDVLSRHAVAIGYQTTALVAAALMGLEVIVKDPRNILWEDNWLELLPYADWHHSEIDEAIEHLWRQL